MESKSEVIYPPCKKCGVTHRMSIKNMETGDIEPLDICYNCVFFGEYKPLKKQVVLDANEK